MKRKTAIATTVLVAAGSIAATAAASSPQAKTPEPGSVPVRNLPPAGSDDIPPVNLNATEVSFSPDELLHLREFFGLDTSPEALAASARVTPDSKTGLPLLEGELGQLEAWRKANSVINDVDAAVSKSGLSITSLELGPPTEPGIVIRVPGGRVPEEISSAVPDDVELRVFDAPYSIDELRAISDEYIERLAEDGGKIAGVEITAVAVEPSISRVELIVEPSVDADALRDLAASIDSEAVGIRVQHQPQFTEVLTTTDLPTVGGQAIGDNNGTPVYICADAFTANRGGTKVMTTAKHCFTATSRAAWYTRSPDLLGVGFEVAMSSVADADAAAIGNRDDLLAKVYRPNSQGWSPLPGVRGAWSNGVASGVPVFQVAVNENATYADYTGVNSFDITTGSLLHSQRASLCSSGGDSGGPVFTHWNDLTDELAAGGIIASTSQTAFGCQAGEETAWTRVNLAMTRLNATIATI